MSRGPWKGPKPGHIKRVIAAVLAAGLRVAAVQPDGTVIVDNGDRGAYIKTDVELNEWDRRG